MNLINRHYELGCRPEDVKIGGSIENPECGRHIIIIIIIITATMRRNMKTGN